MTLAKYSQLLDSEGRPDPGEFAFTARQPKRSGGRRYIDTFFRYWRIALVPVLVLPLASIGIALMGHGNTTVTANVFINQASTKQLGYADPLATPASDATTALTQLLQTKSFDVLVAQQSPDYWKTVAQKPNRNAVIVTDLSKNVEVVPKGPILVSVSYSSAHPVIGVQLLRAILKAAPTEIEKLSLRQASSNVAFYVRRKKQAQTNLAHATADLGKYMRKHHLSVSQMAAQSLVDPAFAALYQTVQSAQVTIHDADQQISQATLPSTSNTFQVYDAPGAVPTSLSKKALALDVAIGFAVGLLLSGAFVVAATAADRTVRYAHEVPELVGLPVLATIPYAEDLHGKVRPLVALSNARHSPRVRES